MDVHMHFQSLCILTVSSREPVFLQLGDRDLNPD
jgi:hypothetical protein